MQSGKTYDLDIKCQDYARDMLADLAFLYSNTKNPKVCHYINFISNSEVHMSTPGVQGTFPWRTCHQDIDMSFLSNQRSHQHNRPGIRS
jgi:hypothetical protein